MPDELPVPDLQDLPQWEPDYKEMQIWWQKHIDATKRHWEAINEVITDLQTKQTEIEALQTTQGEILSDITDILVAIGVAQVTADGALTLAEAGLNPDGTVKTNKVLTDSIAPSNVTRVDVELQSGTTALITDATEYTLLTNTVDVIPPGATGVIVMASAYFDDPTDNTLKARFRLYKNGVEQAIDFKRNDGTSSLFETDLAPVAGDVWHTTYVREGEDFYVSRGQLALMYFDR